MAVFGSCSVNPDTWVLTVDTALRVDERERGLGLGHHVCPAVSAVSRSATNRSPLVAVSTATSSFHCRGQEIALATPSSSRRGNRFMTIQIKESQIPQELRKLPKGDSILITGFTTLLHRACRNAVGQVQVLAHDGAEAATVDDVRAKSW